MQNLKKRSTTIHEDVRRHLGITRDAYAFCAYVHYRCADSRQKRAGWCCDNKQELADFVGITRPGLYKMAERLQEIGLLEVADSGDFRPTSKWIDSDANCKLCLQKEQEENVNKVYKKCKQSLQKNGKNVNKVYTDTYIIEIENKREEEDKKTAPAEVLNSTLNEKTKPQISSAQPPSTFIELHDPETPGATIYDAVPTVEPPPNRINLYDRPNAKTPAELQEALSRFYVAFENEWSAGVLENSKGRKYPKERRTEIVRAFCCHAIKSNRGGDTFQMLNADLQAWFLRQPEFERSQPATTNKNSAVYEPPRNAVY